jgi:periplasmic glucans biosynthesis protein
MKIDRRVVLTGAGASMAAWLLGWPRGASAAASLELGEPTRSSATGRVYFRSPSSRDLRPSLWVEPLEPWGEGSVELIEIPTDDEIHDNIVAMWVPQQPARAGAARRMRYRLHGGADEPHPTPLARCIATRLGRGGEPGKPRPEGVRKFVVEFLGGPLAGLRFGVRPRAVLWASSGVFSDVFTEAVPDGVRGHWRAEFDFTAAGREDVDLRLYLRSETSTLSGTWLYRDHPS